MATVCDVIASLRRAIDLLAERGDSDVVGVADALQRWLDTRGESPMLDAELALAPGWRSAERRQRRDIALIELRRRHFAGLHGRTAARALTRAIRRYETTAWPRDRARHHRPDGQSGMLYDVLSLGGAPGEEALRRLFGAVRG